MTEAVCQDVNIKVMTTFNNNLLVYWGMRMWGEKLSRKLYLWKYWPDRTFSPPSTKLSFHVVTRKLIYTYLSFLTESHGLSGARKDRQDYGRGEGERKICGKGFFVLLALYKAANKYIDVWSTMTSSSASVSCTDISCGSCCCCCSAWQRSGQLG